MKLSMRNWVSIITVVLLVVILFFTRHELVRAWELLGQVNLWILSLFLPLIIVCYFVSGEMMFSYLRQKGVIHHVSVLEQMRISLELNFVNHALPSGGVSGFSYVTWRMKRMGVSASKATMAQLVKIVAGLAAYIALLFIAVLIITIDGDISRWTLLLSSTLAGFIASSILIGIYFIKDKNRVKVAAKWVCVWVNGLVRWLTRGKKREILNRDRTAEFFQEMHKDYLDIARDKKLLLQPFLWGLLYTALDVLLFMVVFWALGSVVNPAAILIAFGLASAAAFFVVTPGGSGAYEALMVGFLTFSGLSQGVAIAGVVLARALILVIILVIGYVFYQHSLVKYGKPDDVVDS